MKLRAIKHIVLINPPGMKALKSLGLHSPNPPIGLAYLAAVLKAGDYSYSVIDMAGEGLEQVVALDKRKDVCIQGLTVEQAIERIPQDTDIIAISCMFSSLWPFVAELTREIRKHFTEAFLVGGGEHITALPEYSLLESELDAAVLGEGEMIFPSVIEAVRSGSDLSLVKGVVFKSGDGSLVKTGREHRIDNLDLLPWPDWESFPIRRYIEADLQNGVNRGRSMPIVATRGCPFKCSFCSNRNMWGSLYRKRSPEDVVAEIKAYISEYSATNFNFQDLTAFVDKKWVIRLAGEIMSQGLKITWQLPSGTRIEGFDREVAQAVRAAGCRNIAFAPETASPELRRSVQKEVDLDALDRALQASVEFDINASCFLVVGFPLETGDTLRATLSYVRHLARLGASDIGVTQFVPYPGSPLFEEMLADGRITLDDEFLLSSLDFYLRSRRSYAEHLSPEELYSWQVKLLRHFYLWSAWYYPIRTARIILKAIFLKQEETRYSKFITEVLYRRPRVLLMKLSGKRGAVT